MPQNDDAIDAIETLQQLGLNEYEAKCFVGLTRLSTGTAKQLSDITDVPRTRVYDAVRVLEANGLVEVQHASPQQFRAVPLEEATQTLRAQYDARIDRLEEVLERTEPLDLSEQEPLQEVWSMTGREAIDNRTRNLIAEATEEVVLVLGAPVHWTEAMVASLTDLADDVDVYVGTVSQSLRDQVQSSIPSATTFISGLEWLRDESESTVGVGRLLLVDRSTILVSTVDTATGAKQAVFGRGFKNGLVLLARRLMAQGLHQPDGQS